MEDAIIVSDIHLGSDNCQAKAFCEFLEDITEKTKCLILNGDVFDSMDFRRLKKHHWNVLSKIRKISDQIEVIWIQGNHDGPAEIISHLLGISVKTEFILHSGDKKTLCLHGDKYDDFITKRPIITAIGDFIYNTLQKIDKSHYWARVAKKSSKQYGHCTDKIKKESIKYMKNLDCDFVVTGHTHDAIADKPYFNSGCWTELPCSYLVVNDGKISLHYVIV